eukprot:14478448-Ditylum_brightwellii.AAC.1
MQPVVIDKNAQYIHEISQRMNAVEQNLESQEVRKEDSLNTEHHNLFKSLLERTTQLETRAIGAASQEMVTMMEHTQQLEKRQKEYDDWKATLSDELEGTFKAQNGKIDQVDNHLKTQGNKLD